MSASVARLREGGAVITTIDPADRRRTLVRRADHIASFADDLRAIAPVDEAIAAAIGSDNPTRVDEIVTTLGTLASLLQAGAAHP
ncbi:hypothetical protein [Nocardia sp. CA-120079]|uniref:hypothetical protein n=1 Tax=Nocardia sp. CA-120079 TaxID=3239974 RepID=UPI003D97C0C5